MINAAVAAHGRAGLWAQNGGYEYPLVLAVVAAGLAITGPGRVSVDAALGLELAGLGWGLGAVAVGVVAAVGALSTRRHTLTAQAQA
jgi:putative oxidoreductase